jgi:hypothetical protein
LLSDDLSENAYGFRDGSILILTTKPRPGKHEPPPGDDTGTELQRVEIVRP